MSPQELLSLHPDWPAVVTIYHRLRAHGYKAFLAGGCVRDALLGIQAHDLDVATDATPDQVEDMFEKTVAVGKSFGVIRVLENSSDIEVASFRRDGPYQDGRHPEGVHWTDPREDALRRDFTVNAMFWDMSQQSVVDYVHGMVDLKNRVIRAVGDAEARFKEDHLRILRALRFAGQLGFTIESQTFFAIKECQNLITKVSRERIREEMTKMFLAKSVHISLDLFFTSGLQKQLFPQLLGAPQMVREDYKQGWQAWVFFLLPLDEMQARHTLESLKFSNKELEWIQEASKILRAPQVLLNVRRGKILQMLASPGAHFAISVLKKSAVYELFALELLQDWHKMQESLPVAFLTGEDVRSLLQGAAIGQCLSEAYCQQLEGKITNRDQALAWLWSYLNNGDIK